VAMHRETLDGDSQITAQFIRSATTHAWVARTC